MLAWRWAIATRIGLVWLLLLSPSDGKDTFHPPGNHLGVWRLTDDPTVRDWANYHNTQCFSPDGRYVCSTHWVSGSKSLTSLQVHDLHTDTVLELGHGIFPRWARRHNWLIYARYASDDRLPGGRGVETVLHDLDTATARVIASGPGAEQLGETTFDDRWLIGAQRFRGQDPEFRVVRIRLPDGGMEPLPEVVGMQLLPNPQHPLFFTRQDHKSDPFAATRYWWDLDGRNQRLAVPTLQQCHMSWLGDGTYMLLGNGLVRGRRWDEPFPSNVHILASVSVGDISPCGTSGRWVCGDSTVADLRSGDGWQTVEPLSQICYPKSIADNSGIYDADPKGSPDGTKICFVSNYPLRDGPQTEIIAYDAADARLDVTSTDGFPDSGRLSVQREVIEYHSKTTDSFLGLKRGLYDTQTVNLRPGRTVTSFDARCLTQTQFASLRGKNHQMAVSIKNVDSPLMRQRMTDVYVVVVRRPDPPCLRPTDEVVQLVPGENHQETAGYYLLRDGERCTPSLLDADTDHSLNPGEYQAVAVEWSGLESEPSKRFRLEKASTVSVLRQPPPDFAWSVQRWTDETEGVRETVHQLDGVIRREWFQDGQIRRRWDLAADGQPIRRTEFRGGQIATREYHHREWGLVSREVFDQRGFITDWFSFTNREGETVERDHWYFDQGMPVKHTTAAGREFVKHGTRWGYFRDGQFVDTPRE